MTRRTGPSDVQADPWEPEEAALDAVQALLDAVRIALVHPEETFIECGLCGEVDSHTDTCPVPALIRWQTEG